MLPLIENKKDVSSKKNILNERNTYKHLSGLKFHLYKKGSMIDKEVSFYWKFVFK
jgi:hypothetical protein